MSVLKRLANIARGKALEWQRRPPSRPDPDELLAEAPTRHTPRAEHPEPVAPREPADPLDGTPAKPKKRRL